MSALSPINVPVPLIVFRKGIAPPDEILYFASNMPLKLIRNPTEDQLQELGRNCLESAEDLAHINAHPYRNVTVENGAQLLDFLRNQGNGGHCFLVSQDGEIVGFINYGSVIPHHRNAFGLVIGKRYTGRGVATTALSQFLSAAPALGIVEINGYCATANAAIIRVMEINGMVRDPSFQEDGTLKFKAN